jgi:integrase
VAPTAAIPKTARPKLDRDRAEMVTWDADEARQFLGAVDDKLWHTLFALALDSGMRRGELLGLRWESVALDAATVAVVRNRIQVGHRIVESSPKTKRSRRTIQVAAGTVDVLKRWRSTQKRARLRAGEAWEGNDEHGGYVFTDALGRALLPDAASGALERWIAHTGVKRLRFHDLRHTSATLDLAAGVHPKIVQEKLGHATVALTLDLYSHVIAGMGADAAASRGQLLYGGSEG